LLAASGVEHARADVAIGFSTPLTGPHAWVGEPHLAGTELAIADLNAKGGILGEPLELTVVDDGCNAELAPLAAEKLVSQAVTVAFGATCSGAAIPASEVYRRAGILMIEAGATNPRLTEDSDGHVFRIVGRDDRQGTIAADYLASRWRDKKIAIVHDIRPSGRGLAKEVKKRLNQRGISEALFAAYQPKRWITRICWTSCAPPRSKCFTSGATALTPASSFVKPETANTTSTGRRRCAVDRRILVGGRPGRRRDPVHLIQRSHP
jgi:ABC-type branched-subunit amino acid transport system substrate-binding protein